MTLTGVPLSMRRQKLDKLCSRYKILCPRLTAKNIAEHTSLVALMPMSLNEVFVVKKLSCGAVYVIFRLAILVEH